LYIELSITSIGKIYLRSETPKIHGVRNELRYNALQGMRTALIKSPAIDPRYACFKLGIRESKIHHRGVYALERIPARRKVIEYTGERIGRRETKRRGQGPLTYLFTLEIIGPWTERWAAAGGDHES